MAVSPVITVDELLSLQKTGAAVHVLDVRWRLGHTDGYEQYLAGHIPGAVFVDLDRDLSRHGTPDEGRHPLPHDADFAEAVRRWGLRQGVPVVIYDDARMLPASRAWWALQRAGVDNVRVLDGGWKAWLAAGGEAEQGGVEAQPGDREVRHPGLDDVLTTESVAQWTGVLLDARAPERYRGETEPLDPVAGHIPGAHNLPMSMILTDDGRFHDPVTIAAAFETVGAGENIPIAAYCGSGVTAAQLALAGTLIGREVTLYPGSWSAWSNTPGAEIETGPATEDEPIDEAEATI
ncbi:sulfurtransferase [Microbacterium sp. YY-01]|uniref:sulfurtransferase n=1 Tax=Microbacterium sp. YY-01 TaxID=3421634 RepID=UPI003D171A69